ncbi:MAG: ROK family protein [Phycisphaerae bacterium]
MTRPSDETALGIDIGGTSCRAAVVARGGSILRMQREPTPADGEPQQLAATLSRLVAAVSRDDESATRPAGVALPGIWDHATRRMLRANNLPRLVGVDLLDYFGALLRRPFVLETDVNAAAWAQWRACAPRPARFVYLSIGTGVGGAAIVEGTLLRDEHGGAGHFGDIVVDDSPDAPAGRTGVRGGLEAVVRHALERARHDRGAIAAAATAVAHGLREIASRHAPDTIALGGGVLDHVVGFFDLVAVAGTESPVRLIRSPLRSDDAGVIGAGLLALQSRF